ncbi:MAG: helix-turn-helix domain-containing protein [Flavobacteriales bacterium]|nr:helix-turn-helix domain-containing protein [Flavobacteriales bacterium]
MLYISDNLKWLRSKRNLSQQEAADGMKLPLDRYKKYEYGKNTPPAETLLLISRYYHISIDLLLTVDLRKISLDELVRLEDNRIVLPIAVDSEGQNLIEIVTHKAKAGYAAGGYADFTFMSQLEHISLPWLKKNEKYRTFPVEGDSMPPHNSKSFIIAKYVEKLGDVMDGKTYIVITTNNEMVYKRLNKNGKNTFTLHSDNTFYQPYDVKFSEIAEIWEYVGSIERENFRPENYSTESLEGIIRKLQNDVMDIKDRIS